MLIRNKLCITLLILTYISFISAKINHLEFLEHHKLNSVEIKASVGFYPDKQDKFVVHVGVYD